MEKVTYLSRNAKKSPFEVSIIVADEMTFINCNCELGLEKKICRHKINAIRGDRDNKHIDTSEETILRLRSLFGPSSTLRQHLEEKWRLLREFSSSHPDAKEDIESKRRLLGEAFSNGFANENIHKVRESFELDKWEESRQPFVQDLNCDATLKYTDNEGNSSTRDVVIEEVFISNQRFYFLAFCKLRNQTRTFRVERIYGIEFNKLCDANTVSLLLDIVFQGKK